MGSNRVFLFLGRLRPGELFSGHYFSLKVGDFNIDVGQGGAILAEYRGDYTESFDNEVRDPAVLALRCVSLSALTNTGQLLQLDLHNWIEFEQIPGTPSIHGIFWQPSSLPINNERFIEGFREGLRFAGMAHDEPAYYYSLEDYGRALDSTWDEAIYHCHHTLENIKCYFGDWAKMRGELSITEATLRSVTDMSNVLTRHGGKWELLSKLTPKARRETSRKSLAVTKQAIELFREYLHNVKNIATVPVNMSIYEG